jgi:dTDP-4-dehydrorhamnose 3,5-epimerase-like enzyme
MNFSMIKEFTFPSIVDEGREGLLRVFESSNIPFSVKRVFTVLNSEVGSSRGKHAHRVCNQLICCVSGGVKLICDDGLQKEEIDMTPISAGVLVPAGIWAEQQCLDAHSVILVFCDQSYNEDDYIRQYDEFMCFKGFKK